MLESMAADKCDAGTERASEAEGGENLPLGIHTCVFNYVRVGHLQMENNTIMCTNISTSSCVKATLL